MSTADRILIIVATYNELDNLPRLVAEIAEHLPCADVLVIDDASPDGTGQWCEAKSAEDPRVRCLHRGQKLGLGSAIRAGLRYAVEQGYQYVINMDADFSHPPARLPDLVAGMDPPGRPPVDVMIGSRYIPGSRIEGWPLLRHLMSRGVNLYSRMLLGLKPKDVSGGFRCYRTSALAGLDWDAVRSQGYAFFEEILWRLDRQGARFAETPIVFVNRKQGASKIDFGEAASALSWILWFGMQNLRRPRSAADRGSKAPRGNGT